METQQTQATVIGKDAAIEGTLTIKDSIRIDGRIKGELASEETVTIGAEGTLEGDVHGKNIVIGGKVNGSVTATERVKLESNAILNGDIVTLRLVIEEGARFEGSCSMSGEKKPPSVSKTNAAAAPTAADKKEPATAKPGDTPLRI